MVSLSALRWLADQNAAFTMLDRDGSVLAVTGPVRSSDVRLRRAQALAHQTGAALRISRELITHKIAGQERMVRDKFKDFITVDSIAKFKELLSNADSIDNIRIIESQAAAAYWSVWNQFPIEFPKKDLPRVPIHWRAFSWRKSPLSGSPRHASNPINAILNYLYALLESESRLALAALGLDPGLGVLHADTTARDNFACDLMEPVRPQVDSFVFDLMQKPLKRDWFFEQRDGNCRLMAEFAIRLTETSQSWARAVAPYAEWVSRILWTTMRTGSREIPPPTRLTNRRKYEARGRKFTNFPKQVPTPQTICRNCGKEISSGRSYCMSCNRILSKENMIDIARSGRVAAQSSEAQAKRSQNRRLNAELQKSWNPTLQPAWLTQNTYQYRIQPALKSVSCSLIVRTLNVSESYAGDIRAGRKLPHPRHWQTLSKMVGISPDS